MMQQSNNTTFDFSRLPESLSEDHEFLQDIFQRFPDRRATFEMYLEMHPMLRVEAAARILQEIPRSGWLRFDPELKLRKVLGEGLSQISGKTLLDSDHSGCESVLDHCFESAELCKVVFKNSPESQMESEVLSFHDFHEAISGDFTPFDNITREEKTRYELIALELLTESRHENDLAALHVYNCVRIFEGYETDYPLIADKMQKAASFQLSRAIPGSREERTAQKMMEIYSGPIDLKDLHIKTKDTDVLQMLIPGTRIMKGHNYSISNEKAEWEWQRFLDSIDERIKTPEARNFFSCYQSALEQHSSFREVVLNAIAEYNGNSYLQDWLKTNS